MLINKTDLNKPDIKVCLSANREARDETLKILRSKGMTLSGIFRLLMIRIIQDGKLPFDPPSIDHEA